MQRWGLSDEDVENRIRWHALMEPGALRAATHLGARGLGEKGEKLIK